MNELLNALTRAAVAVAEYYEMLGRGAAKSPHGSLPCGPAPANAPTTDTVTAVLNATPAELMTMPEPRKRGRPRLNKEKTSAAPEIDPTADVLGMNAPANPAQTEMTEQESSEAARETVVAFIHRFDKIVNGKPEGHHMAKKIITEELGVPEMKLLNHAQRIIFIARMKEIIAEADKKAVEGAA